MKNFFVVFNLFFILQVNAQTSKEKFDFNAGIEYRMTPFNFNNSSEKYQQYVKYDRDKQLGGISFFVGIDYQITNNLKLGLSQAIRYDEKYYSDNEKKLIKGLILDTHLDLKYFFKIRNENFFVLVGYSFMNQNTKYKETQVFQSDENGNPISSASIMNSFSFDAYKFGIGYNYKKFNFVLGSYYIIKEHNFSNFGTSAIGMPYLQLNYNVFKF